MELDFLLRKRLVARKTVARKTVLGFSGNRRDFPPEAGYRFTGCSGFVGDRPGSLLDGRLPRWLRTDPSGRRYCMNRREKVVEKFAGIATILPLLTAALSA